MTGREAGGEGGMLYYKVETRQQDKTKKAEAKGCTKGTPLGPRRHLDGRREPSREGRRAQRYALRYEETAAGTSAAFLVRGSEDDYAFGLIETAPLSSDGQAAALARCAELACFEVEPKSLEIVEVPFDEMRRLLHEADRRDNVRDEDEVLEACGLDEWASRRRFSRSSNPRMAERIVRQALGPVALYRKARALSGGLAKEVHRVLTTGAELEGVTTQPVGYVVASTDSRFRTAAAETLFQSLRLAGRVRSSRVTELTLGALDDDRFESLARHVAGAPLVLRVEASDVADYPTWTEERLGEWDEALATCEVGTPLVVSLDSRDPEALRSVARWLPGLPMVAIQEDELSEEEVATWLAERGLDQGAEHMGGLTRTELEREARRCHDERALGRVRELYAGEVLGQEEPSGDALAELDALVGLADTKRAIHDIVDAARAERQLAAFGRDTGPSALHMSFSGNPGTAKTTVARLVGRILHEEGVLEKGHTVEVAREALVGKYVGHTAPLVERRFREAKGGVLFIDEAYSLLEGHRGSYGDEAIDAIVRNMENLRGEVVVILAGYPDEMSRLLDRNPGLRSRVPFHVDFPDYTAEELLAIAHSVAEQRGLYIDPSADEELVQSFRAVASEPGFGNGRFARTAVERAAMRQGSRLLNDGVDDVTEEEACTLRAKDFDLAAPRKRGKFQTGFAA